jgi:hypothetical protein
VSYRTPGDALVAQVMTEFNRSGQVTGEGGHMAAVEQLHMPLTLDAGGATVDVSEIASIKFAKGVRDLDREFKKGSDVRVTLVCRVVNADFPDKYDGHGNISETKRRHFLRADELESIEVVAERDFTTVSEAAAAEAQAAADAAADGGDAA